MLSYQHGRFNSPHMLTNINAKQLANLYNMHESTLHSALRPHREKLNNLATKHQDPVSGKTVKKKNYNSDQLKYIIETIFGTHTPLGYTFNGDTLIKQAD